MLLLLLAALAAAHGTDQNMTTSGTHPNGFQTFILDGIWGSHKRWEKLRARVEAEVGPCQIWHYDNSGATSLEMLGRKLAVELAATGTPFNIIGYSMGGLVIREALRQFPNLPAKHIALLNSPHGGTLCAHLLPLAACRDMRPGSPFLRRLDASPWTYRAIATWCPGDLMVVPGASARWSKATLNIRSDVPAHIWPVVSSDIHSQVITFFTTSAE